ncbi:MAG TPA: glucose 1-dehydrogenase [Polyangiaceae bacterium]|nr:glucose 1-dehydrogenase [Polyangiaceae bacterium]
MARSLAGRVALVVGGSSGIGKASALALAEAGAKVVVAARREAEGAAVAREIVGRGGEALFVRADATVAADVRALVAQTVDRFGRLDCAFNNMGVAGDFAPVADLDEAFFDHIINANLKSVWLCMKYEIPQMVAQGGGSIVNMSSYLGYVGHPYATLYGATKNAIMTLTKGAAVAYAKQGLRVNAVSPGVIGDTPIFEQASRGAPEGMAAAISEIPLGRVGKPSEVADAVVWLCSDQASFINGHALPIEGGRLAVLGRRRDEAARPRG